MKDNKRIFVTTLMLIFVLCFVFFACADNSNLTNTSTAENYISEIETNSLTEYSSSPEVTQDNKNTSAPETENDIKITKLKSYDNVISEWKATLKRHINDDYTQNDIFSFSFYQYPPNSPEAYFALYDIDKNGTKELLLKKQNQYEDIIAYIFTIKDGEPINLFGYNDEDLPWEVPWSRVGSSKILDNGLIDCYYGDLAIYKIAEDGYSVIKFASSEPYDYPDEANLAEAKWRYCINEIEVDYNSYVQHLDEHGYMMNGNNSLAEIHWKSID